MDLSIINENKYYHRFRDFLIALFAVMLIGRFTSFYWVLPRVIDTLVFAVLTAGSIFFILVDLIGKKSLIHSPNILWLVLFFSSCVVSCLIYFKYGWTNNLKALFSIIISLFFLYAYINIWGESVFKKHIILLQRLLIISWFILAIISIGMFFVQYSNIFYMYDTRILFGCIEGRLFGVFSDPNYASVVSILTIVFSIFLLNTENNSKLLRTLYITNIYVQFIYISLGSSRTGEVCLLLILFLSTFVYSERWKFCCNKIYFRVLCCIVACLLAHFALEYVRIFLSYIPSLFSYHESGGHTGGFVFHQVSIERPDVVETSDISNLRFRIWSSAIDIFKTTWLFGASPRNALLYAKEILPDAFIVKRGYDAHNFYIATVLYTGVCGVITLGGFLVNAAIKIVRYYIKNNFTVKDGLFNVAVLCVVCVATAGMFLSDILFITTIESLFFWLFLGFIINTINKTSKADNL